MLIARVFVCGRTPNVVHGAKFTLVPDVLLCAGNTMTTSSSCCEGHFCEQCINRILYSKDSCPLCREKNFEAVPSKKYSLNFQSLEVYCKMICRGCPWTGPLRDAPCIWTRRVAAVDSSTSSARTSAAHRSFVTACHFTSRSRAPRASPRAPTAARS